MGKKLTTVEVARRLGITQRRVNALIEQEKLPAERFGERQYMIDEDDLPQVAERKIGRPKKAKEG